MMYVSSKSFVVPAETFFLMYDGEMVENRKVGNPVVLFVGGFWA
jgi:hypothetical protein